MLGLDPSVSSRRTLQRLSGQRFSGLRFAAPENDAWPHSIPSSSMIMPSIILSPICQNPGSFASSPNGASSSP